MKTSLLMIAGLLLGCSHAKDMSLGPVKDLRLNGVYMAYDPYTHIISDPRSMKINKGQEAVYIIRFLDEKNGVLIPGQLKASEPLTREKIEELYQWALGFETKNPEAKDFVHFSLRSAKSDSIVIVQHAGMSFSSFKGINAQDSLLLNHDFGLDLPGRPQETVKRPLVFKFYALVN